MTSKQITSALLFAFLMSSTVSAQAPAVNTSASVERSRETRKVLESNALVLIEQVINDSPQLIDENRIFVLTRVIDLMWKRNEKEARSILQEVTRQFLETAPTLNGAEPDAESLRDRRLALRQDLLEVLARHDPKSALEFLHASRQVSDPDLESQLSLSLASTIGEEDPDLAVRLAEQSLRHYMSLQFVDLVTVIQNKDRLAAARLANSVLLKLQTEDFITYPEAIEVACGLLRVGVRSGHVTSEGLAQYASPLIDEQGLRKLAEIVSAAALRSRPLNAQTLTLLQEVLPEVERYAPRTAARVRRNLTARGESTQGGNPENDDSTSAPETLNADGTEKDAASPFTKRVTDFIREAGEKETGGEAVLALELLNQARGLIGIRAKNAEQLVEQFLLACAYASLAPRHGFEIIETMVDRLNQLADAVVVIDGFLNDEQLARGDQLLLVPLAASWERVLEGHRRELVWLALADFDRIKSVTDGFQRAEVRIMARLLLAQSVLSDG
ncbi:MAG: hypothetical protein H7Z16_01295 [Pyrinomonadaceae bacterium]|nr:hypothetical protein [Pyrinomonadaceae bacterium]